MGQQGHLWDPQVACWQAPPSVEAPLGAPELPEEGPAPLDASELALDVPELFDDPEPLEDALPGDPLEPAAPPEDALEPPCLALVLPAPVELAPLEPFVAAPPPVLVSVDGKPVEGVVPHAKPSDDAITKQPVRSIAGPSLQSDQVVRAASFGSNFSSVPRPHRISLSLSGQSSMRLSVSSRLVLACVAAFAALEIVAMRLYPGGTWWDPTTRGASFWQNYICDLESEVAGNGMSNLAGARFGKAAILVMVAGFTPFWWIVPRLFPKLGRLGLLVRVLGFASLAGITAVALMPSSRFGWLHGVAVLVAGAPGLSAAVLAVAGLLYGEAPPRVAAALGGSMLVFALADFVLYTRTWMHGGPGPLVLPVAQKLALVLLLAWMVAVAWKSPRT